MATKVARSKRSLLPRGPRGSHQNQIRAGRAAAHRHETPLDAERRVIDAHLTRAIRREKDTIRHARELVRLTQRNDRALLTLGDVLAHRYGAPHAQAAKDGV